jgi:hypothetical protein
MPHLVRFKGIMTENGGVTAKKLRPAVKLNRKYVAPDIRCH